MNIGGRSISEMDLSHIAPLVFGRLADHELNGLILCIEFHHFRFGQAGAAKEVGFPDVIEIGEPIFNLSRAEAVARFNGRLHSSFLEVGFVGEPRFIGRSAEIFFEVGDHCGNAVDIAVARRGSAEKADRL